MERCREHGDAVGRPNRCKARLTFAAVAGLLALGGCATGGESALLPAEGHALVAGSPLAVEGRNGVSITADGDAWEGWPQALPTMLTPVWVTVQNGTDEPIRILYREFRLRGESGPDYAPIRPYAAQAPGSRQSIIVSNPGSFEQFYIAYYLASYYPWLPVWGEAVTYRPDSPRAWQPPNTSPSWQPRLPTVSMIDQALPEGVLKPGGRASGFLYFQKVGSGERAVTFRADLRAVREGRRPVQQVAAIEIPFRVTR